MKPTEQIVNVEFKDHDKIILTNSEGDTYTSKSEELMDFFTRSHGEAISQMQPEFDKRFNHSIASIKNSCEQLRKTVDDFPLDDEESKKHNLHYINRIESVIKKLTEYKK